MNFRFGEKDHTAPGHLRLIVIVDLFAMILISAGVVPAPVIEPVPLRDAFCVISMKLVRITFEALEINVEALGICWFDGFPGIIADALEDFNASVVPDAAFWEAIFKVSCPFTATLVRLINEAPLKRILVPTATAGLSHDRIISLQKDWSVARWRAHLCLRKCSEKRCYGCNLELLHFNFYK